MFLLSSVSNHCANVDLIERILEEDEHLQNERNSHYSDVHPDQRRPDGSSVDWRQSLFCGNEMRPEQSGELSLRFNFLT